MWSHVQREATGLLLPPPRASAAPAQGPARPPSLPFSPPFPCSVAQVTSCFCRPLRTCSPLLVPMPASKGTLHAQPPPPPGPHLSQTTQHSASKTEHAALTSRPLSTQCCLCAPPLTAAPLHFRYTGPFQTTNPFKSPKLVSKVTPAHSWAQKASVMQKPWQTAPPNSPSPCQPTC